MLISKDQWAWQQAVGTKNGQASTMNISGSRIGPAGLLKKKTSWLDDKVVFVTKDDYLEDAAMSLWKITKVMRARQGEKGLSVTKLAGGSGVRRQTVTDLLIGRTWPEVRTLVALCHELGLEINVSLKD